MSDPRQITDLEDIVGKTAAFADEIYGKRSGQIQHVIRFTDGTFLCFDIDSHYGDEYFICFRETPIDPEGRLAAGLITQEEHDKILADFATRDANQERATYERLKAKFEAQA